MKSAKQNPQQTSIEGQKVMLILRRMNSWNNLQECKQVGYKLNIKYLFCNREGLYISLYELAGLTQLKKKLTLTMSLRSVGHLIRGSEKIITGVL